MIRYTDRLELSLPQLPLGWIPLCSPRIPIADLEYQPVGWRNRLQRRSVSKSTVVISATQDGPIWTPELKRLENCEALLRCVRYLLPPSMRADVLDEWLDELRTAALAEENARLIARSLSMACLAPRLTMQRFRPVKARDPH
jgi:hypothetical protein